MTAAVVIAASATGAVELAVSSAFMGSATRFSRGPRFGAVAVLGEYSPEVFQTASACGPTNFRIKVAELQPGFATLTEGIAFAAQASVRLMGIARSAPNLGGLRAADRARRG